MKDIRKSVIVIAGPTAVGKTEVSTKIAQDLGLEIINADSRQVFKELNIGTAKPTASEMGGIKHYFINELNLNDPISAGIFEREALSVLDQVFEGKDAIILTGGSGLYIDALLNGLDPFPEAPPEIREVLINELNESGIDKLLDELSAKDPDYFKIVDRKNPQRIVRALEIIRYSGNPFSSFRKGQKADRPFRAVKVALDRPREELYERIDSRVNSMIEAGLFKEAEDLKKWKDHNALQTVGYQEIYPFLEGDYSEEEAVRLLKRNSRRYAKRQLTWLRRDPEYQWFHPDEFDSIEDYIKKNLNT